LAGLPGISVSAGIVWRNDSFLALQRPEGKRQAGAWEFPGGKIKAGEDPVQALIRELKEELGIVPRLLRFWKAVDHDYADLRVTLHVFHVRVFSNEPHAREGHVWRWLTPRQALELPFLEADMPLVRELADF